MKEITLNGRTYLSTKRAAEITGYTTDYVGQLARKGTVAAEQVGRNWYVAEDEIKKHKFGAYAGSVREEKEVDAPALEILVEEAEEKIEVPAVEEKEEVPVASVVEEESVEVTREEESTTADPAATVAAMQEAWDEWYRSQRVVASEEEEVFLKREDVRSRESEIEDEEPVVISKLPEDDVETELEGEVEESFEEEQEVEEVPSEVYVQQKGGLGLVMGTIGLLLVFGLVVGGGYIVVRNDLAPLSSVIESTQNYFTGTTTFERDNR